MIPDAELVLRTPTEDDIAVFNGKCLLDLLPIKLTHGKEVTLVGQRCPKCDTTPRAQDIRGKYERVSVVIPNNGIALHAGYVCKRCKLAVRFDVTIFSNAQGLWCAAENHAGEWEYSEIPCTVPLTRWKRFLNFFRFWR